MQQNRERPLLGITMGDPSGIGPEIILKALMDQEIYELCYPLVIGDMYILSSAANTLNLNKAIELNSIKRPEEAEFRPGRINIISISGLSKYSPGRPYVEAGKAMASYIEYAVKLAMDKKIDAMVTCPINKRLLQDAGIYFEGHTEYISYLTKSEDHVMMLAGDRLKVSLVTIHSPLRVVPSLITEQSVCKTILITAQAFLMDFGIDSPRIAVAGLNPHAGESGLFGSEEKEIIKGIELARGIMKVDITGPLPPDTVYYRASHGEFDVVVSMYHDQGLIPLKLLHFSDAVNVTLGLPIIRTSVDHGTAYDISGTGKADPSSLKSAIRIAVLMAKNRKKRGRM